MGSLRDGKCPQCGAKGSAGTRCASDTCLRFGSWLLPLELVVDLSRHRPDVQKVLGTAIDGQYIVAGLAGSGSFGVVYRAVRLIDLADVAVKVMNFGGHDERGSAERTWFRREVEAVASLRHPNIVEFMGSGEHIGQPYLAMEFVAGGRSLGAELFRRQGERRAFSRSEVAHIVGQTADALTCAHTHPNTIIHRDLKPDNIMLAPRSSADFNVKIVDFGLAKSIAAGTRTQFAAGTVAYMAPEQLTGRHLGPHTDVYALACIALEMLCGRPVFDPVGPDIASRKRDPHDDPLRAFTEAGMSADVEDFFRHGLAMLPGQRIASAADFKVRLLELLGRSDADFGEGAALADAQDVGALGVALASGAARTGLRESAVSDKERELAQREAELAAQARELEAERLRLRAQQATPMPRESAHTGRLPAEPEGSELRGGSVGGTLREVPSASVRGNSMAHVAADHRAPAIGSARPGTRIQVVALVGLAAIAALYLLVRAGAPAFERASDSRTEERFDASLLGEPSLLSDELGDRILRCFHPTGTPLRSQFGAAEAEGNGIRVRGAVDFRGAITENRYRLNFELHVRRVDGKREVRVVPTEDTAVFPPSGRCAFRGWVPFD